MRAFLVMAVVAAVFASSASAQDGPKWFVFGNGEIGFPTNPSEFTDGWNALGGGVGGGAGTSINDMLSVAASFNWFTVGIDEDFQKSIRGSGVSVSGGRASIIYVAAAGKFALMPQSAAPISPYVVGGVGYYRLSVGDLDVTESGMTQTIGSDSENAFGINGGIGIDIPLADKFEAYVEVQYIVGFTEDTTGHLPIRGGINVMLGE